MSLWFRRRHQPEPVLALTSAAITLGAGGTSSVPPGPPPSLVSAAPIPPADTPDESVIVSAMLAALQPYLPHPILGLPPPGMGVVSLRIRRVGVGDVRGTELRASYPTILLKGIRLDAVVRFQLWAGDPTAAAEAATTLQGSLLHARDTLRAAGFLTAEATNTAAAEPIPTLNAWRQSIDLSVLYEYPYEDSDDAWGLIARIPVTIAGQLGSGYSGINETMLLTDAMAIWNHPDGAPPFIVDLESSPDIFATTLPISALTVLAYLPAAWDGHAVAMTATTGGVGRQQVFPTVRDFVNSFAREARTVDLGNKTFVAGTLTFPFPPHFPDPLILQTKGDNLRISYADPALDDADAVLYLRVLTSSPV